MAEATTFEQIKPTILSSFRLEGAKEWRSTEVTEYEWGCHPKYPNRLLVWAESNDQDYILYEVKVLDTTECESRGEKLIYTIGRTQISKKHFDNDSEEFNLFKKVNALEETTFFRDRMEYLISKNQ